MTQTRFSSFRLEIFLGGLLFLLTPWAVHGQRALGTDVSSYQGSGINWSTVKSDGISFAWAKAAEATPQDNYIDPDADFAINEQNAKAAGVPIGPYYFCHPNLDSPSTAESYFWSVAGSYVLADGLTIMPMLDYEVFTAPTGGLSDSTWANDWCQDVVSAAAGNGVKVTPVIYFSACDSCLFNSSISQWISDIADYSGNSYETSSPWTTGACTPCQDWGTGVWSVWQYADTNPSGGDSDVFNGTVSQMLATLLATASAPLAPANITVYWDPGAKQASPGSGGNGTWNLATADWWYTGTTNYLYSSGGDNPIFAGGAGTVTLTSGMTAGGLTFDTAGYTLTGGQTLTLTNNPAGIVIPPPGSQPVNFNCAISTPGACTVSGGGVLVLNNAANSIGGPLNIASNTTIVLAKNNTVGFTTGTITLTNGAILQNNDVTSGDAFLSSGISVVLGTGGGYLNDNNSSSLTYGGVISGPGNLTKIGGGASPGGTLILTGTNTYSGSTIIKQGVLALGATGSINNSHAITIDASGTLDVSAISGWTLGSSDSLTAAGTGTTVGSTAAAIKGAGSTSPNLGNQPVTLIFTPTATNGDSAHPSLYISAGTLTLSSGNSLVISNASGAALGRGQYTLIQQASGSISGAPNSSVLYKGPFVAGTQRSVSVTGATVILTIASPTTTAIGALSPSAYGQTVSLTATVSPAPDGGTVQFYDNGAALGSPVTVNTNTGQATLSTSALAAGNHPITASYSGVTLFEASSTSGSTTQQITAAPLNITASAQSKQYGATEAFGPGSTNFTATGLQNGDTVGSVTLAVSGNGGAASAPVGTYSITPSAATGGTFNPANYNIAYNPGTLTVTLPPNTTPVSVTSATLLPDGTVEMNFNGTPGYVYYIEAATNLNPPIPWIILSTNAADTNGNFNFIDNAATNFGERFYQTQAESD